jgi:hypothetical protein
MERVNMMQVPQSIIPKYAAVRSIIRAQADPERVEAALTFIDMIAEDVPAPRVKVGDDGDVRLLWQQGCKYLVLCAQPDGVVRYAVEFGRVRGFGRHSYKFSMPTIVAEILDAFRVLH